MVDNKGVFWFAFICLIAAVACYPTGKTEQEPVNIEDQNNEKYLPNGTVVGKYSYLDKEGNPIQVKYYADDASYGVELKSFKVLNASSNPTGSSSLKDYSTLLSNVPDNISNTVDDLKDIKNDPLELLNKEIKKLNQYKTEKSSPDFEIYYQNELDGPKQCGKEKVRVYFDKERKARNTLFKNLERDKYLEVDKYLEANKFCEQF